MHTAGLREGAMQWWVLAFGLALSGCKLSSTTEVYFSSTEGVVVEDGMPVPGVEVARSYGSHNSPGDWTNEVSVTDECGRFSFEPAEERVFVQFLGEAVVGQKLEFRHKGKQLMGWQFSKHNTRENTELGRPIKLLCDVRAAVVTRGSEYSPIEGICEHPFDFADVYSRFEAHGISGCTAD